jgi:hypothetical protein
MEKPVDGSRERDQSIEQLLRQSLRTPQHDGVTESCLDAETLAAWADGALSGAALEAVQLHVADCARCQDLVGTLARINSTAPQTESVRASRRWLAWLVPLTAAAAALVLWVVLPGNNARTALVQQERKVQDNDQVAELRAPQPGSPETRVQPFRATPAPEAADTPAARARRDAPQQRAAVPETPSKAESGAADKNVQSAVAKKVENAAAREKENVAGRLEVDNLRKTAEPPATLAAPAAPAAVAAPAPAPPERGLARSGVRAADASATEILSPDPAVRWRILGSAVQHSANGGATWEAAPIGVAVELTAGAAPSAMVCWLVGRDGVVLVTTDGRTWRRVPFPETTDLSSVRATDAGALVVSVSTTDGRTFVTIDGGLTWMSR